MNVYLKWFIIFIAMVTLGTIIGGYTGDIFGTYMFNRYEGK